MERNIETLLKYFSQIRKYYADELKQRFKEENFSHNEIAILILLSNNKSITTCSQLTFFLGVSKGLVSRSVDSLIDRGLVSSVRDPADKRVQHIRLTEEAGKLIVKLKKEIEQINDKLLGDISEKEIAQMEATIMKIINRFKDE